MSLFASSTIVDGVQQTDRAYRKIELQDPADLTYLIAKVSRTAREKIDKHLPPDAAPDADDKMRARVETLIDEYIRQTFDLAKPNLSVNGMDSQEWEAELANNREGEDLEPFEAKLVQRIQQLSSEIEEHTLDLANMRRSAPSESAQRFQEAFAAENERLDRDVQSETDKRLSVAQESTLDVGEVARMDDIRQTWLRSTDRLSNLGTNLDSTIAKLTKAQQATDFVKSNEQG